MCLIPAKETWVKSNYFWVEKRILCLTGKLRNEYIRESSEIWDIGQKMRKEKTCVGYSENHGNDHDKLIELIITH